MSPQNRSGLSIHLFGALQIEAGGVSFAGRLAKKERWLLALLALRPGQAVTREYLAGLLWPDTSEEQALYYLRRSLSVLRSVLGAEGDHIEVIKPRSLQLDLTSVFVDVQEFERLLAEPQGKALELAIALYRGPLLEDCAEDWAFQERVQREGAYHQALDTLTEQALTRSDWTEAVRYSRLLIAADPLQEKAHRALMQAQAHSGNHAAASQAYRDLRVRLREEVNADPDPQTTALYDAIREQARQAANTKPAITLAPSASTVTQALPFPQSLTRLIGREQEQEEVQAHLANSRLVTLVAAGGVGKTRLALEVARHQKTTFTEGAAFVELAPLTDPERVPRALAQTLGISEEPDTLLLITLSQALQHQERLIVLDNCEHLSDACATLAHSLLTTCPGLRILATSRQALGVTGEIVWRVPSLTVPPDLSTQPPAIQAKMDDAALLEYPSVQLFLERVHQTLPEFRLAPTALPTIAQICCRLDGIPLAIELAASRIRTLSLEHIAARLDDRFRLLTGGSRAALPRHQTLRAALDWSYVLLSEVEKTLLRRLAVFAGGWTLDAAEAVCSGEDIEAWEVLDVLSGLVDKSLVVAEGQQGAVRYHLLETMREYAREKLEESGERQERQERHRDWCIELVEEASQHWNSPQMEVWVERCGREAENLRAALLFSRNDPEGADAEIRLAGSQWKYWNERGQWKEGLAYLQSALSREGTEKSLQARAHALNGAGALACNLTDFALAREVHLQALSLRRQFQDRRGIAASLHNLGNVVYFQGELSDAWDYFTQAQEIHKELGNQWAVAYTLMGLGNVCTDRGDFENARPYYQQALDIFREARTTHGELLALGNLGSVQLRQGNHAEARPYFEAAVTLSREAEYPDGEATYIISLGEVFQRSGEFERALDCYGQALRLAQKLGSKQHTVNALETLATLLDERGDLAKAARLYGCTETWRARIRTKRPDIEQRAYERRLTALRAALGEATFAEQWTAGEALPLETALTEMLAEVA